MPRYTYKCRECEVQFDTSHSIHHKLEDCEECKSTGSLFRIITSFKTSGLDSLSSIKKDKPGKIVNQFINDTKRELDEYKNNIAKSVSGPDEVVE